MLGETRKITASERFYWALSEAAGFFGKVKTTVASLVNGEGFRTALKSVLGAFGKNKNPIFLKVPEDQLCAAWRGISKKYRRGFFMIPDTFTKVLLYQNGKLISLPENEAGAIYPFSEDPKKKASFWKPRTVSVAEVACVRDQAELRVFWGNSSASHIVLSDGETQKSWRVLSHGQLRLRISDVRLAYEKLLHDGYNTEEALQDFLRDQFITKTRAILNEICKNIPAPSRDSNILGASFQMALGEKYYEATKNIFKDYGLEMCESTKYTIFTNIFIKPFESEENATVRQEAQASLLF